MNKNKTQNIFLFSDFSDCENRIPNEIDELNTKAPLQYNLDEDCSFQPLHSQSSLGNGPSAELIGRFKGEVIEDGDFKLEKIEFKFFDISKNPRCIKVGRVELCKNNTEIYCDNYKDKKFIVILIHLIDDGVKREKDTVDAELTEELIVSPDAIIDFHIVNNKYFYPELPTNAKISRPAGLMCRGRIKYAKK